MFSVGLLQPYLHNHFHRTVQDPTDPSTCLRLVRQQSKKRHFESIGIFQHIVHHFCKQGRENTTTCVCIIFPHTKSAGPASVRKALSFISPLRQGATMSYSLRGFNKVNNSEMWQYAEEKVSH